MDLTGETLRHSLILRWGPTCISASSLCISHTSRDLEKQLYNIPLAHISTALDSNLKVGVHKMVKFIDFE